MVASYLSNGEAKQLMADIRDRVRQYDRVLDEALGVDQKTYDIFLTNFTRNVPGQHINDLVSVSVMCKHGPFGFILEHN